MELTGVAMVSAAPVSGSIIPAPKQPHNHVQKDILTSAPGSTGLPPASKPPITPVQNEVVMELTGVAMVPAALQLAPNQLTNHV
jgi:hypothetical protein